MDFVLAAYAYIVTNASDLLAIALAVEVVAVTIVNLTPTTVDNSILAAVHKVLVFIANIVPNTKTK